MDGPWTVRIHYEARRLIPKPEFAIRVSNAEGALLAQPCTTDYGQAEDVEGTGFVEFRVARLPLIVGGYGVEVWAWDTTGTSPYDYRRHSYNLQVLPARPKEGYVGPGVRFGLIKLPGDWVWPDEDVESRCAT